MRSQYLQLIDAHTLSHSLVLPWRAAQYELNIVAINLRVPLEHRQRIRHAVAQLFDIMQ